MSEQDETFQTAQTPVDTMLSQIQKHLFPDGAMATAWVLATEWIDVNGEYFTVTLTDEKAPAWHHSGLLTKAQMELDNFMVEEDVEEE